MKKLLLLLLLISSTLSKAQENKKPLLCGVDDSKLSPETIRQMQMAPIWLKQLNASRVSANERYVCRIAIEVDSDTYNQFGGDTTLIKYEAMKQVEFVSKIYEKEINTQLVVTLVHFWKDSGNDPYKGIYDIFTLLDKFATKWNTDSALVKLGPKYDKVIYMVSKGFYGAGGIAYLNGKQSLIPWGFNGDSRGLATLAHEMGHNFGSPHTQSCSWPGGVIDYCYPAESDCYEKSLEIARGTIMSYCSGIKSTFHPLCQALMYNHAQTNLKKITALDQAPVLPLNTTFENNTILNWEASPSADKYFIEISQTADFSTKILSDTSSVSAYNCKVFKNNNQYYFRVKAINSLGETPWSNISSIRIQDSDLLPPVLTSPLNNATNLLQTSDITLKFNPVGSATSYEIQVSSYYDPFFTKPLQTQTIQSNTFTFRSQNDLQLYWRVRALNGSRKSAWSEVNTMWMSYSSFALSLPLDGTNLPLTFPIGYYGNNINGGATVRFTISSHEDFSDPVLSKSFSPGNYLSRNYTCLAENLSPNTTYFLKAEEIYDPKDGYLRGMPNEPAFKISKKFTTGTTKISGQWSFINSDNYPALGRDIKSLTVGTGSLFLQNNQGLVRLDTDSLKIRTFDCYNTNGILGNTTTGISAVESDNSVWTSNTISKRISFNGVFPRSTYAISQINQQTGNPVSVLELTKANDPVPELIDMKNKLISSNSGNSRTLYRLESGGFTPLFTFENNQSRYFYPPKWNEKYAWVPAYNYTTQKNEYWRCDLSNKTSVIFNSDNVKVLEQGASTIDSGVDSKGNFWALIYNNSIGKYRVIKSDGNSWQDVGINNPLIYNPIELGIDSYDNIYVLDLGRVLKYDGTKWKNLGSSPLNINGYENSGIGELTIDNSGKIWFNNFYYGLIRFDPCDGSLAKPELSATASAIELGQSSSITAKGCTNVVWNWKNNKESVSKPVTPRNNKLDITPALSTTYTARCYEDGCMSAPVNLAITVLPALTLNNLGKAQNCPGDTLKVGTKISGEFDISNQFKAYLYAAASSTSLNIAGQGKDLSFSLPNSLSAGKYYLRLEGSSPKVLSKDSLEINILATPSVTTTGAAGCIGANISIGATGGDSYLWKGPNAFTSSLQNPAFSNINSSYAGAYLVTVTGINGCRNTGTANVVVNPNPNATASVSSVVYEGLDVQLLASGGTSYSWSGPGNYSSAEQNPIIKRISKSIHAGTYVVNVTDANGCKANAQTELKIETALANDQESNTDFKVYPNPASDKIQIVTGLEGEATIQLYDATGKEISTQTFFRQTIIPVRNLSRGTYFFIIQQKDKKTTGKVRLE